MCRDPTPKPPPKRVESDATPGNFFAEYLHVVMVSNTALVTLYHYFHGCSSHIVCTCRFSYGSVVVHDSNCFVEFTVIAGVILASPL